MIPELAAYQTTMFRNFVYGYFMAIFVIATAGPIGQLLYCNVAMYLLMSFIINLLFKAYIV